MSVDVHIGPFIDVSNFNYDFESSNLLRSVADRLRISLVDPDADIAASRRDILAAVQAISTKFDTVTL